MGNVKNINPLVESLILKIKGKKNCFNLEKFSSISFRFNTEFRAITGILWNGFIIYTSNLNRRVKTTRRSLCSSQEKYWPISSLRQDSIKIDSMERRKGKKNCSLVPVSSRGKKLLRLLMFEKNFPR